MATDTTVGFESLVGVKDGDEITVSFNDNANGMQWLLDAHISWIVRLRPNQLTILQKALDEGRWQQPSDRNMMLTAGRNWNLPNFQAHARNSVVWINPL